MQRPDNKIIYKSVASWLSAAKTLGVPPDIEFWNSQIPALYQARQNMLTLPTEFWEIIPDT